MRTTITVLSRDSRTLGATVPLSLLPVYKYPRYGHAWWWVLGIIIFLFCKNFKGRKVPLTLLLNVWFMKKRLNYIASNSQFSRLARGPPDWFTWMNHGHVFFLVVHLCPPWVDYGQLYLPVVHAVIILISFMKHIAIKTCLTFQLQRYIKLF